MNSTATPTRVLSALALCLLTLGAFAPLSAGERSGSLPSAHASRTISLNETGRLHLTSKHNFTLNEQGSATGTVTGTIYVHLTAVSSTRVTAEVNIYRARGLVLGQRQRELSPGEHDGQLRRLDVDQPRHRQLRPRARVGAELQRHDRRIEQRRDHRARKRQGVGLMSVAGDLLRRAPGH